MYIKKGSAERVLVKQIQEIVGAKPDGYFGPGTEKKVIAWQLKQHLVADGIVGPKTMEVMGLLDTDIEQQHFKTENGLLIHRHYLDKDEYVGSYEITKTKDPINNDYLFLHHTAGNNNPYKCIDHWNRDKRGRVATEFVLGGPHFQSGNTDYDGVMVQAFPEGNLGWHLGKTESYYMNRHSVGLEICNFGYLDDNHKNYVGRKAHPSQVCELKEPFKRRIFYHKYSDAQLKATKKLIEYIADRDNINIDIGLIDWIKKEGIKAFEFKEEACKGNVKGLLTHTNVRKDKSDCSPQPEFIDMLLSI